MYPEAIPEHIQKLKGLLDAHAKKRIVVVGTHLHRQIHVPQIHHHCIGVDLEDAQRMQMQIEEEVKNSGIPSVTLVIT